MTRARNVKRPIARPAPPPAEEPARPDPSIPAWVHAMVKAVEAVPAVKEVWYVPTEHGLPALYFVGPKYFGSKFKTALHAACDHVPGVPTCSRMWGDLPPTYEPSPILVWSRPAT